MAGRLGNWRSPWVERAAVADIVPLVALLGVPLIPTSVPILVATISLARAFAAVILTTAALPTVVLPRRPSGGGTGKRPCSLGASILVAVAVGQLVGRWPNPPAWPFLTLSPCALLALVAFDL